MAAALSSGLPMACRSKLVNVRVDKCRPIPHQQVTRLLLMDTTNSNPRKHLDNAAILARWILGCLFTYMGLAKAVHPVDFLKLVHQYDVVHTPFLLNSIEIGR